MQNLPSPSLKVRIVVLVLCACFFAYELTPAGSEAPSPVIFAVNPGEGFRAVADGLSSDGLIRSRTAFEVFATFAGDARALRPGFYRLDASMSSPAIAFALSGSSNQTVSVTVPEGDNLYQIDGILSNALVIRHGALVAYATATTTSLEGYLFPDTYQFFSDEPVSDVVQTFTDNFAVKAVPLLPQNPAQASSTIILASILEKEVQTPTDQKIVAGILLKRIAAGIPLDVDATVCYAKQLQNPSSTVDCATLAAQDFKINSPYNTYLYRGLPPGPIGNPGTAAIEAALNPESSPYFYYLTDPITGKTIYATTLLEQNKNRLKYLKG